jgi:hypothetical protein
VVRGGRGTPESAMEITGVCGLQRRNSTAWGRQALQDWVRRERGSRAFYRQPRLGQGVRV